MATVSGEPLPVIVSAAAGAGRPELLVRRLDGRLRPRFDPQFVIPASIADLRAAVRAAAAAAACIAVAGGDGTLHHAVNALGDADLTLAPLPAGSGNDFCRGIGLGTAMDTAADALVAGGTRRIDLLEVNGVRVLTVAGIGVVAESALQVARLAAPASRWRPLVRPSGANAYLASAGLRLLAQPHITTRATVRCQDAEGRRETTDGLFHGAFMATLPTLGAGLRLPISSRIDDGQFELALIPSNPRLRLLWHLPRLRRGRAVPADVLHVVGATAVEIAWTGGTSVLGDGEHLGRAETITVRVLPQALRVVAPE